MLKTKKNKIKMMIPNVNKLTQNKINKILIMESQLNKYFTLTF